MSKNTKEWAWQQYFISIQQSTENTFFQNILYGSASVTCKPDFKSFYNLF